MAEKAGKPVQKKIKLDPTTQVFINYKKDKDKLKSMKWTLESINAGHDKMNFILTKFIDLNASSPVSFSRATCVIEEPQPTDKIVAASIFEKGVDVLEKYVQTENRITLPEDERQRSALCKLLNFLMEDHTEFLESGGSNCSEGEWACKILYHILIKLAVDNKFVITADKDLTLPPDQRSNGDFGDTSFGCENGWHGHVDILLENNLPVQLVRQDDDNSVSSIETSAQFLIADEAQLIAQTIVFSFLQHKNSKSKLNNFLIPAIGLSTTHLYIYLYDCINDVFISSDKNLELMDDGKYFEETIVLLWLALNYRDFCTGIKEDMKDCKSGFHKRLNDDLLREYFDNVRRPVHVSTKRNVTSLKTVRGRQYEREVQNEYFDLII